MLPDVDSAEAVSAVARKFLRALEVPFELDGHLGGHTRQIGASVGVALYPQHSANADELLTKADRAMYAVKERGKNGFHLFAQTFEDENDSAALERALYEALALEQFELHYQPIFDLDGRISAVEALVRWRHPERGLLSPAAFIEVAEAGDIIVDLGKWVLRSACAQAYAWRQQLPHLRLAVNVAPRQLSQPEFVGMLKGVLDETGFAPEGLELEITERSMISETSHAHLNELRALGVGVALDDFGVGQFSLSHLQTLPLSCFKLDRSFVQGLDRRYATQGSGLLMLQTVVALAQALGIRVVAEGVETKAQLATLRALACDEMQGFLLARPMEAAGVTMLLERQVSVAEVRKYQAAEAHP